MIKTTTVDAESASVMPLSATQKNLAMILQQLQNRPYGWGGIYFLNDCSQEMKTLFTPFAIWMPRNTAPQSKMTTVVDLSPYEMRDRIRLLKELGHPMLTMVYIGGHVMLYLGNQNNIAMTYQNIWGLSPVNRDRRYVIGQAAFLPLLEYYPEYPELISPANSTYFKLIHLDELNDDSMAPSTFSYQFTKYTTAEVF